MDMYLWILSEKCSTLKSKDISLPTKVHIVKAMVFPVVMYGTWTIKKAEHQRIDAFEPWCWRRLLRVPWTAQRSHHKGNQSWILTGRTDAEAETQILWSPDVKNCSLEKTLMLGKIEGGRRRGQQRMRWLDGITDSMSVSWWWTGRPGVLQSMGLQRVTHDWVTELNRIFQLLSCTLGQWGVREKTLFQWSSIAYTTELFNAIGKVQTHRKFLLFTCDSLRAHKLQHIRISPPSWYPVIWWDSCPLNQLYHPTMSSSVAPFSFCPQSSPVSGSFPISQLFASSGQSIGVSASASVLQWIFRTGFL